MNKIQSPIILKKGLQSGFHPTVHSSAESNRRVKNYLSPTNQEKFSYKQSPALTNFSVLKLDDANNMHQEIKYLRFSRFCNWHLTQMIENKQVFRQATVQKSKIQRYLQQSSQSLQAEEQEIFNIQTLTPKKPIYHQKEIGLYSSSIKNSTKINTPLQNADKMVKPKQTGLRKLSSRAYKIVKQYGEVTYKDVASKLIRQIFDDQAVFDDEKQQNNIKRRVYDALNVLIAMGILVKIGKNIAYGLNRNQQSINLLHKQKKQAFIQQIQLKKKQLVKKKQEKKKLLNKMKALHQVISRNKQKQLLQQNIVKMPFIYLKSDPSIKIQISEDKEICTIQIQSQYVIQDGLEALPKLFLDKNK